MRDHVIGKIVKTSAHFVKGKCALLYETKKSLFERLGSEKSQQPSDHNGRSVCHDQKARGQARVICPASTDIYTDTVVIMGIKTCFNIRSKTQNLDS